MTPKEKAIEICSKMAGDSDYKEMRLVKKYALIAVDEIINCDSFFKTLDDTKYFTKYWREVQSEIILL